MDENDTNAASTQQDDTPKRRSSRLIKRKKFEDEMMESGPGVASRSPLPKTRHARIETVNVTSTSSEIDNAIFSIQSIPEAVIPNIVPSTSYTQPGALENPTPLQFVCGLEDQNTLMYNYEQEAVTASSSELFSTFTECKELQSNQSFLNKVIDPPTERQSNLPNKKIKGGIKILESQMPKAKNLVLQLSETDPIEFDSTTLALLCGQLFRYSMRSKEMTIGCSSKYQKVDVDLQEEALIWKISKEQATICLHNSGNFFITTEDKNCLNVDGIPLATGSSARLNHESVVVVCAKLSVNKSVFICECVFQISGMKFIFFINHQLINTIKQEAFRQNQIQLPVQIVNQTQKKQKGNEKSQTATMTKSDEPVPSLEQLQQELLEKQQTQNLVDQQLNILEENELKELQQEDLEEQLNLLEAEMLEHKQRQNLN